jgi:argininosuccinate lyase
MSLLTTLKGLPMTYNRDLQEDKEPFIDTDRTVSASLEIMAGMVEALRFNTRRMENALRAGFLNATELADYLVGKGVPFRDAHHITGNAVALAEDRGKGLEDLTLEEFHSVSDLIGEDVFAVLDYRAAVERRCTHGGTGPASVAAQLAALQQWLSS